MRRAIGIAILLLAGGTAARPADLTLENPSPTQGEPVVVRLEGAEAKGAELRATYRPGSRTERTETVGPLGPGGSTAWSPVNPGITRLVALDSSGAELASCNVAVRFRSLPPLGILIFLLAGALLFGGASLSMRWALEEEVHESRRKKRPSAAPST